MSGPISEFFHADHRRLDGLLQRAIAASGGAVDETAYAGFRAGLLRHIALEEKLLLPGS